MRLVYIAGPFRGPSNWAVCENVRAAERIGLEVAKLGAFPVIPHANTAHFDGLLTAQFWLDGTMALLRRCDAIVMVPGWERSQGSCHEYADARDRDVPVFEWPEDAAKLAAWIERTG